MAGLTLSAAFGAVTGELRRLAEREFAHSDVGRLYAETRNALASSARLRDRFARLAKKPSVPKGAALLRQLVGGDYGQLVREVEKYAKSPFSPAGALVREFIDSLGPIGTILEALAMGGKKAEPDLASMANLLRSYGYTVIPPEKAPKKTGRIPQAAKRHAGEMAPRLKTIELPMGDGSYRRFDRRHPIVTAEMVETPDSTNVCGFAYHADAGALYVRFWADEDRTSKGSLYRYEGVTPEEFLKLYRVRTRGDRHSPGIKSPGTFVWEVLRIAGTISGHRKDYHLAGVARGYVPRKVTEYEYVARRFRTVKGEWLTSALRPGPVGFPNRGTPRTGAPNRGAPRR